MVRKDLEAMGLSKENVDAIMKVNGEDIENAKTASASEIKNLQTEITGLKTQVTDRDKQLETLKASTGDAAAMKEQIATLQADNTAAKQTHEAEMNQLKVDFAVEKALTGAKAKNVKAVKALLDLADAKLDKDGGVKGLQEQIDKLTADEGTKFLFEAAPAAPQLKGVQPGASGGIKPGTASGDDLSKMSYEELTAYMEANPNATLE